MDVGGGEVIAVPPGRGKRALYRVDRVEMGE